MRLVMLVMAAAFALAACDPQIGATPGARIFWITAKEASSIQFRHVDSVNALRQSQGLTALQLSSQLNAAAATHANDMSLQGRPWHFGSDGSSPIDRVARTGYPGRMISENISETFENDLETLDAWLDLPEARADILHPDARYLGLSWKQDSNGKIWWVQLIGS